MPTIFCIPTPPARPHLKQHVVWCFHFIWCPPILTVVCFTAFERSMVHNNSGHPCFEIGILHIHRNHWSIIAITPVISTSIVPSAIVVVSSLPSPTYHTSSTSSSNSSILFLLPSSSSYTSSSSLYIGHHTCTLIWYITDCCACCQFLLFCIGYCKGCG